MRLNELLQHLPPGKIAIAYSGGLDSSALLHLAVATGRELHAFHIHHGLSPNADAWEAHCRAECERLGVKYASRRVTLSDRSENSARKARYAALGALCTEHGVEHLLTAHHLDDQAETILLQLLRGSGVAGLSGMDASNHAAGLLGTASVLLVRPLLQASRAQLEEYVREHGIAHIEDESNADLRYARNALRHEIMPKLAAAYPGYQERFARSARHAQAAQRLLTEQAAEDLQSCLAGAAGATSASDVEASLDMAKVRALSADRIANLLRHWFTERGIRLPSSNWLAEMQEQALTARDDANLKVTHPDCDVRRHRDRLYLVPRRPEADAEQEEVFRWDGEASIDFPHFGGTLHIEPAELGLDPAWLRQQMLTIAFRSGGARLKPARNRPTRTLKQHYQTLGIPAWERERMPMVSIPGHTLYAGGIGMDCRKLSSDGDLRLVFRWEAK
ncbi:tRNA lysidine(34) synthetase TilS [Pseudoduganella sp. DS3]|uniref:tRNA(Ile)-lysidine synthase n=1 Tax=Pseudoduganella guangdongensis TaxID=2692179 RepID=A0A6N9HFR8_9BURK|nr:tRNA lysidine(34) synthetase TilS [Pseudoduganella guangdongensis]MYN02296.1 tRNA lysidine(34) synthetase TilS [Pseudoduganella guangdongensis]